MTVAKIRVPKAAFCALCLPLAAAPGAFAQTGATPDKPVDLKPMLPPIIPPLLPPNSYLTPGTVGGGSSTYSGPPLNGSSQSNEPVAGFKLTIPNR